MKKDTNGAVSIVDFFGSILTHNARQATRPLSSSQRTLLWCFLRMFAGFAASMSPPALIPNQQAWNAVGKILLRGRWSTANVSYLLQWLHLKNSLYLRLFSITLETRNQHSEGYSWVSNHSLLSTFFSRSADESYVNRGTTMKKPRWVNSSSQN